MPYVDNLTGKVKPDQYSKVLSFINTGLAALYHRFNLKENTLYLRLVEGLTSYELKSVRGVSNLSPIVQPKYIEDAGNPFKDDLVKVMGVYTEKGTELSLNDSTDPFSVYTPTALNLLVNPKLVTSPKNDLPDEYKTDTLKVVYQALHPPITEGKGFFDPSRITVELPYTHLQALLFYVASRAHSPMGMVEEGLAGSNWFAKYENECRMLESLGGVRDSEYGSNKFINNGWV